MTIGLRNLKKEDASLMLEWMHDPDIQKGFKKKMLDATLKDAQSFIEAASNSNQSSNAENLHFAIVDKECDKYLGTVSLKNIDYENGTAEYAIVVAKSVQNRGVAYTATGLVLKKAFYEIGLHRIFLSVYSDNLAAIRLYEKSGFKFEGEFREHFIIAGSYVNWKWYGMLKEEFNDYVSNG